MNHRCSKVCVFIDNSALFAALRTANSPKIDYKRLKDWLVGSSRTVSVARYYCGEIRSEWHEKKSFYDVLERAGYDVVVSRNHRSREKHAVHDETIRCATHVQIAWDMYDLIIRGRYDTFILVSGAGEFSGLIKLVRERGIDVEVAFLMTL